MTFTSPLRKQPSPAKTLTSPVRKQPSPVPGEDPVPVLCCQRRSAVGECGHPQLQSSKFCHLHTCPVCRAEKASGAKGCLQHTRGILSPSPSLPSSPPKGDRRPPALRPLHDPYPTLPTLLTIHLPNPQQPPICKGRWDRRKQAEGGRGCTPKGPKQVGRPTSLEYHPHGGACGAQTETHPLRYSPVLFFTIVENVI